MATLESAPVTAKRCKRVYVYWSAALVLLMVLGLLCWAVIPIWRVHQATDWQPVYTHMSWSSPESLDVQASLQIARERLDLIGGATGAPERLRRYLRVSPKLRGESDTPGLMLAACGSEAVPVLMSMLADADQRLRGEAVRAFNKMDDPGVEQALLKVLAETDPERRALAAYALGWVGRPSSVPSLRAALKDKNARVRQHAANALFKMGADAKEVER